MTHEYRTYTPGRTHAVECFERFQNTLPKAPRAAALECNPAKQVRARIAAMGSEIVVLRSSRGTASFGELRCFRDGEALVDSNGNTGALLGVGSLTMLIRALTALRDELAEAQRQQGPR